ncbi:ubiquinol-cytochrome c reductase complex assembly factor 6 sloth 2 [Haemaphysalis longicornis]
MPYGYSWPAYLRFAGAAMLSMFAGAQCVHQLYRPLDDLGVYIEEEKKALESSKLGQGQPSDTQQSKHEVKGS